MKREAQHLKIDTKKLCKRREAQVNIMAHLSSKFESMRKLYAEEGFDSSTDDDEGDDIMSVDTDSESESECKSELQIPQGGFASKAQAIMFHKIKTEKKRNNMERNLRNHMIYTNMKKINTSRTILSNPEPRVKRILKRLNIPLDLIINKEYYRTENFKNLILKICVEK